MQVSYPTSRLPPFYHETGHMKKSQEYCVSTRLVQVLTSYYSCHFSTIANVVPGGDVLDCLHGAGLFVVLSVHLT